jgi:fatty-acyl-CoA synthase
MTRPPERTDVLLGGTASWIATWASRRPDHPCVIFDDTVTTWSAFDRLVTAVAQRLAAVGVSRGDRVGCLMPNRTEYLATLWATTRLGAIFVPYNVRLVARELALVIGDSDPTVVVIDSTFATVAAEVDERRPTAWLDIDEALARPSDLELDVPWLSGDDPAAIVYTSGTTGRSKGAVLTHGNFLHQSLNNSLGFGIGGDDRHLHMLALCYVGGLLSQTLGVFSTGATLVLEPDFDPERALRRIEEHRITWIGATPNIVQALIEHPTAADRDLSSLTRVQVGGAPVPVPLAEKAQRLGIAMIQTYGCTEATGGSNFILPPEDVIRKAGSCGKAAPYDQVKIVDAEGAVCALDQPGEMLLRGPLVMKEYWLNPAATAETLVEGWLHTGDVARQDAEGYVTIVGRKKELIISGGLNVYPVEVESVLETFPEVAEVAVVGLPDEKWGEQVSAFVVFRDGMSFSSEQLVERCRTELAGYRIPRRLVAVDDLPRTTSGKIRRAELVERWVASRS